MRISFLPRGSKVRPVEGGNIGVKNGSNDATSSDGGSDDDDEDGRGGVDIGVKTTNDTDDTIDGLIWRHAQRHEGGVEIVSLNRSFFQ